MSGWITTTTHETSLTLCSTRLRIKSPLPPTLMSSPWLDGRTLLDGLSRLPWMAERLTDSGFLLAHRPARFCTTNHWQWRGNLNIHFFRWPLLELSSFIILNLTNNNEFEEFLLSTLWPFYGTQQNHCLHTSSCIDFIQARLCFCRPPATTIQYLIHLRMLSWTKVTWVTAATEKEQDDIIR